MRSNSTSSHSFMNSGEMPVLCVSKHRIRMLWLPAAEMVRALFAFSKPKMLENEALSAEGVWREAMTAALGFFPCVGLIGVLPWQKATSCWRDSIAYILIPSMRVASALL